MAGSDHYAVLGVLRTATADEIKAAFHQAALRLHPDKLSSQVSSSGASISGASGPAAGSGAERAAPAGSGAALPPPAAAAAAFQALQDAWQVGGGLDDPPCAACMLRMPAEQRRMERTRACSSRRPLRRRPLPQALRDPCGRARYDRLLSQRELRAAVTLQDEIELGEMEEGPGEEGGEAGE